MHQVDIRTLSALGREWAVIVASIVGAWTLGAWWAAGVAALVIATRQHALLMLYHDGVHGHAASSRALNDVLINAMVGVPMLMPVEGYRAVHLEHHRKIGREDDPERQLLYVGQLWNYRGLTGAALVRQLAGDLFLVNGLRTVSAWRSSRKFPRLRYGTFAVGAVWAASAVTAAVVAPAQTGFALALWLVPMLTLTQLLQKLRSFAEHSGGPGVTPGWEDWTYSWRVGLVGRLTLWPYNINYHREHHARPELRWHELPGETGATEQRLTARDLWPLLTGRGRPSLADP